MTSIAKTMTASVFALAACLAAPAAAQDGGGTDEAVARSDTSYGIEEIIVTANKREASLQDTPLAISAIGGGAMEERGIDDVSNLQSYVPNLRVGQEQDGVKITLRGIGIQGTSSITDNGVAFYQDNFYLSRPAGGSAVFYDVNRVEVLRGPQGTLYGRNATGGVINVISNEPTTRGFEGEVGASYGSRNLWEVRGWLNAPLGDVAAARISAVYTEEDGYVKNLSGPDLYGSNGDLTVRGQIKVGDVDSVELLLYGLYSKLKGSGTANQFLTRNIGGPGPTQALLRTLPPLITDPLVSDIDAPAFLNVETKLAFARLRKDFGGVEAYLQVGRMWQDTSNQQDFDGSPVDVSIFNKTQDNKATSVEARLSSTGDGPFSWILGGYYFDEETYIQRRVRLKGLTPGGIISLPDFLLDEFGNSSTIAGFASLTYALSDAFRVTGGIRYTEDKKDGRKITLGNFGQPFPPDLPNAQFPADVKFDKVTWKVGLEYDVSPDVFAYASVSNGYKAGGFNLSSDGRPYNPETITAYEAGIKSDLFDRTARVNVDAFYYDYTDLQLTTLGVAADGVTPGQFTTNAAASTIWGVELDTQWELTPGFLFTAGYSYIDATFDEYVNRDPLAGPGPALDLAGNRLPFVSKHTVNLGLQYETTLGSGTLTLAANTNFHSDFFLREFNNRNIDRVEANTKTDLTATYRLDDVGLRFTAYVTNLEDNVERNNIYLTPGFIGVSPTTAYTKPRTVGVRVDYAF
jgi:iron complex outermembrane receptor protein